MKLNSLLLVLMFAFTSLAWVQETPSSSQPPASPRGSAGQGQMHQHQQRMMEMHKEQMEAMNADVEKMKSSLAAMKANVAAISDAQEKARWQSNVDMWETLVGHMDRMLKRMESMGPGMMQEHGMGSPPAEKKPE